MTETSVERRRLNRNSPVPLYYQLLEALQEQIDAGVWQPQDMLPSEADLCEMYDVSRTVVRQALDSLERTGLIHRVKGKGAYVSDRRIMAYLLQDPKGFYDNMASQGLSVETQVLDQEVVPASARVAEALDVPAGSAVLRLERLRSVRGVTVFLATSYIPQSLCANLAKENFSAQPLFEVMTRRCSVRPAGGKRVVEAVVAGKREAELLSVPMGSPLLRLVAVTYDENGRPLEYSQVWLRGDRIAFEVNLG